MLGLRRQTYYKRKKGYRPEELDKEIAALLYQITQRFTAWGFWLTFHYLRRQGYYWNHKRVYRVWKQEGLNLRPHAKRRKLKRAYLQLLPPGQVNEGWAMDFLSDWIVDSGKQKVRVINVMDECSRKALWVEGRKSISAQALVEILDSLVEWRGKPAYIRCDNGPEFISKKLQQWAKRNTTALHFIQPGKPSQNGLVERLNGTIRAECLELEWFENLESLNERLQEWWQAYNYERPHSAIGYKTPDEFETLNTNLYFKTVAA